MDIPGKVAPFCHSLLRLVAGLLFLEHGTSKFLDFPHSQYSGTELMSMAGFAGSIELIGGLLITLGLFTRPAAFIASGTMAVAYFMAHAPQSFFPLINGGAEAILYCFVFLYLAAAGGGPISLDAIVRKTSG
ncbi:DoxX family protein [uncultured Roseibium sp.]|uniref:DoxX family protein n=1 Tax=uncultured Roseibium sp. TaxID=1936171 RepID=UPI00321792C7